MQTQIVRFVLFQFAHEFIHNPYTCYTEHGQHALFYSMLYHALPAEKRYVTWHGQKVCVIQKEYPTAGNLGKPRRQHWDIAVIKSPPESIVTELPLSYDFLRLSAVVEFGLNEAWDHLEDDIDRLRHPDANLEKAFLVHLYRLSKPGAPFSHRDWSPKSANIISKEKVAIYTMGTNIESIYGIHDSTGTFGSGAWLVKDGQIESLC